MELYKAFRFSVRILYQKLFAVITALTIIALLFLYILIAPSIMTKWQDNMWMVFQVTAPLFFVMYGILIFTTFPPILNAWINISLMASALDEKGKALLSFTKEQLQSSYYSQTPLYDREWFFCISHSHIHICNRKYIRKVEYTKAKTVGARHLYGVRVRTSRNSAYWLWFSNRQDRDLFINWQKRYR